MGEIGAIIVERRLVDIGHAPADEGDIDAPAGECRCSMPECIDACVVEGERL